MSQSLNIDTTFSESSTEAQTKFTLSKWLEGFGLTVYWEQKNEFGYPTFSVDDAPEKPDLLVQCSDYIIGVEVKPGESKSSVYDALIQNNKYWLQYATGKTEYTINGREIGLEGFVVATEYSIGGHLFETYYERRITPDYMGDGRLAAVERGKLPPSEFSMTEAFSRIQWRIAKIHHEDIDTGVGVLLSTSLEDERPRARPAVLWRHLGTQRWEYL